MKAPSKKWIFRSIVAIAAAVVLAAYGEKLWIAAASPLVYLGTMFAIDSTIKMIGNLFARKA